VDGISSEHPETIRRKIGVLPESLGFPRQMTGIACLTFFGRLYGRTAGDARSHGLALLQEVGLEQRANSLIATYSRGMRQRLGIARALVNNPRVVFLDEPTLGLDPRGQRELLTLVQRIARERNAGVILCSHFLSEIEAVCDDVVILRSGEVVAKGSVTEVIGRSQPDMRRLNLLRIQVSPSALPQTQQVLQAIPNVMKATPAGETAGWLEVELADSDDVSTSEAHRVRNEILAALIRADIPIMSFESEGRRLQDVFLQLTEEEAE
jgi:ABC-2 type transport system ATP-binding protein